MCAWNRVLCNNWYCATTGLKPVGYPAEVLTHYADVPAHIYPVLIPVRTRDVCVNLCLWLLLPMFYESCHACLGLYR